MYNSIQTFPFLVPGVVTRVKEQIGRIPVPRNGVIHSDWNKTYCAELGHRSFPSRRVLAKVPRVCGNISLTRDSVYNDFTHISLRPVPCSPATRRALPASSFRASTPLPACIRSGRTQIHASLWDAAATQRQMFVLCRLSATRPRTRSSVSEASRDPVSCRKNYTRMAQGRYPDVFFCLGFSLKASPTNSKTWLLVPAGSTDKPGIIVWLRVFHGFPNLRAA